MWIESYLCEFTFAVYISFKCLAVILVSDLQFLLFLDGSQAAIFPVIMTSCVPFGCLIKFCKRFYVGFSLLAFQ